MAEYHVKCFENPVTPSYEWLLWVKLVDTQDYLKSLAKLVNTQPALYQYLHQYGRMFTTADVRRFYADKRGSSKNALTVPRRNFDLDSDAPSRIIRGILPSLASTGVVTHNYRVRSYHINGNSTHNTRTLIDTYARSATAFADMINELESRQGAKLRVESDYLKNERGSLPLALILADLTSDRFAGTGSSRDFASTAFELIVSRLDEPTASEMSKIVLVQGRSKKYVDGLFDGLIEYDTCKDAVNSVFVNFKKHGQDFYADNDAVLQAAISHFAAANGGMSLREGVESNASIDMLSTAVTNNHLQVVKTLRAANLPVTRAQYHTAFSAGNYVLAAYLHDCLKEDVVKKGVQLSDIGMDMAALTFEEIVLCNSKIRSQSGDQTTHDQCKSLVESMIKFWDGLKRTNAIDHQAWLSESEIYESDKVGNRAKEAIKGLAYYSILSNDAEHFARAMKAAHQNKMDMSPVLRLAEQLPRSKRNVMYVDMLVLLAADAQPAKYLSSNHAEVSAMLVQKFTDATIQDVLIQHARYSQKGVDAKFVRDLMKAYNKENN